MACEQHVLNVVGQERALIARVGLIAGPGDLFDRSGYWPLRFARPAAGDGGVLVPEAPGLMTQVIDVRDLARWLVDSAERQRSGIFNAIGEPRPLADHLATAREVAGHSGSLVRVDQDWLVAHDVSAWMGPRSLPLWLMMPEYAGLTSRDSSAALNVGLAPRPLAETLADTLAWELTRDPARTRAAGLSDADERSLLRSRTD